MEEFIQNIKVLTNTLGHKVFEEKRDLKHIIRQDFFFIKAIRGADAKGEPTSEGFVVFKESKAAGSTVSSMTRGFLNLRQRLIDEGVIKLVGDVYLFLEDYIFSSPSTASSIILGRNSNGLTEWKLKSGKTLKEFESSVKIER